MFGRKRQQGKTLDEMRRDFEAMLATRQEEPITLATAEETRAYAAQRISDLAIGDVLTQRENDRKYSHPAPGERVVVFATCTPEPGINNNTVVDFAYLAKKGGSPWQVMWCDSHCFERVVE